MQELNYLNLSYFLALVCLCTLAWVVFRQYVIKRKKSKAIDRGAELSEIVFTKDFHQVGDFEIYYEFADQGFKNTIVFVHGIGASTYSWRFMSEYLGAKANLLMLDLPGFGRSTKDPTFDHDIDSQSLMVHSLVQSVAGNTNIVLVGSSMGGTIVMWLCHLFPETYHKICLISPAVAPLRARFLHIPSIFLATKAFGKQVVSRPFIEALLRRTIHNQSVITEKAIDAYYEPYKGNVDSSLCLVKAAKVFTDTSLWERFVGLEAKCLLVWGAKDKVTPVRQLAKFEKLFPHWDVEVNKIAGHHVQEDNPKWLTEKILENLI